MFVCVCACVVFSDMNEELPISLHEGMFLPTLEVSLRMHTRTNAHTHTHTHTLTQKHAHSNPYLLGL